MDSKKKTSEEEIFADTLGRVLVRLERDGKEVLCRSLDSYGMLGSDS